MLDSNLDATANMNIIVTQKARKFLQRARQKQLYIQRVVVTQCCIPLSTPPNVRKGTPRKPENYHKYYVEDIEIYYDRDLIHKPILTIDTKGFGFREQLMISDWIIRY